MDGRFLADNALVQAFFHLQQFLRFALHHLRERDTGPLVHNLGDIVHVHHFVELVVGFPADRAGY
jgi:hypothetical protein